MGIDQVVRDSELKRERKAYGNGTNIVKRRKRTDRNRDMEVAIDPKKAVPNAGTTNTEYDLQGSRMKEMGTKEVDERMQFLHSTLDMRKTSPIAVGTKSEKTSSFKNENPKRINANHIDGAKSMNRSERATSVSKDLVANIISRQATHIPSAASIQSISPSESIMLNERIPCQSLLKRKREGQRNAEDTKVFISKESVGDFENTFGISLRKTPRRTEEQETLTNGDSTSSTKASTNSPWCIPLKKVKGEEELSIISPQPSVKIQNISPWSNVKLKPVTTGLKMKTGVDLKSADEEEETFTDTSLHRENIKSGSVQYSAREIGSATHSSIHNSIQYSNGEGDSVSHFSALANASQSANARSDSLHLEPDAVIDLSNLPLEMSSAKSKPYILPISHDEGGQKRVIIIANGSILVAKMGEDDHSATVLWYRHFNQITSLNMKTNFGATGLEITSVDSEPYFVNFKDPSVYMTLVQRFLDFKNGVEEVGASEGGIKVGTSILKEQQSNLATFDENEWEIITKFRDMLRRGTPENAVRYRLDTNYTDISENVKNAIFEVCRGVERAKDPNFTEASNEQSHTVASHSEKDGDEKDIFSSKGVESLGFGVGGIAAAAAAAALKRNLKLKGLEQSPQSLVGVGIAAAALARNLSHSQKDINDKTASSSLENENRATALKDDPEFEKYFKMLKMNLPMGAVKQRMKMDGMDPSIMDLDHDKSLISQQKIKPTKLHLTAGLPLKDDPEFEKYFKMLKMNLPMGAVKQRMEMDGMDPSIMDLDHDKSLTSQQEKNIKSVSSKRLQINNKKHRRLHWTEIDEVKEDSIWAKSPEVKIHFDPIEISRHFQEDIGAIAKDKIAATSKKKKKSDVMFINPTRAQNGGIILAGMKRLRLEDIVNAVDEVDNDIGMSIDEVQSINDYIPKEDELNQLMQYRCQPGKSENELKTELCEYEKFIFEMTKINQQKEKASALLFKLQFSQRKYEIESSIALLNNACDELRGSHKFKDILKLVLELGNNLNTAGQTRKGKASGITLESINKLSETKGLGDGKGTTVLEFIVKNILEQNEELGEFKEDIPSVLNADKLIWSSVEEAYKDFERSIENMFEVKNCPSLHEFKMNQKLSVIKNKSKEEIERDVSVLSVLKKSMNEAEKKFNSLTSDYFGESGKKVPNEWFENICKFSRDFYLAKSKISAQIAKRMKATAKKKKKSVVEVTVPVPRKNFFTTPKTIDRVSLDLLLSIRNRKPDIDGEVPKPGQSANREVSAGDLTSEFDSNLVDKSSQGDVLEKTKKRTHDPGKHLCQDSLLASKSCMSLLSSESLSQGVFEAEQEVTAFSPKTSVPEFSDKEISFNAANPLTPPEDMNRDNQSPATLNNSLLVSGSNEDLNLKDGDEDDDLSYASLKGEDDDISFATHSSQRRSLAIIPDSIAIAKTEL